MCDSFRAFGLFSSMSGAEETMLHQIQFLLRKHLESSQLVKHKDLHEGAV